jgi:general secretion pathway protein I
MPTARYGWANDVSERNGFTLIEMMVALAVFSLAALALLRLESATIRGAGILDSTLTAQMVARNATGVEQNGGRAWTWSRQTAPTGDPRIVKIDVTVADAAGARQGRVTMVRFTPPTISAAR